MPVGTEINSFLKCEYGEAVDITIWLNVLEIYSGMPLDFRNKDEILQTIEDNKKWEEEYSDYVNKVS